MAPIRFQKAATPLRVRAEVGIVFIMRQSFIGRYDRSIDWPQVPALAALVATGIAMVQFQPKGDRTE